MLSWLYKLRQKPEPVRRLIAFWSSALIVFVMVSIWLAGLPGRISQSSSITSSSVTTSSATSGNEDKTSEMASPFASMQASLEQFKESVKSVSNAPNE